MFLIIQIPNPENIINSLITNTNFINIITIISGILGMGAIIFGFVRNSINKNKKINELLNEVKSLSSQKAAIQEIIISSKNNDSNSAYVKLNEVCEKVAKSVNSEVFSVSIAVPNDAPTHLKIILSSDPNRSKIMGREFTINTGIAGWVFKNKKPSYTNGLNNDPRHFNKIDKAAGTNYGNGSVLTLPLIYRENSCGVVQFFKLQNQTFSEADISISHKWLTEITKLMVEFEDSPNQTITSLAYNNTIQAVILFCDICSFSEIASKISIQTTVDLLNEYYNRLLQIAINKRGKLEEYVGDGLYISFTLKDNASSIDDAISAAIEMQHEYNNVLDSWMKYEHPVSKKNKHAIGMAFGTVYRGSIGHPDIRQEKLVGNAVNLAAHNCGIAKNICGGILVCENIANLVTKSSKVRLVKLSKRNIYSVVEETEY